jgi:hypothetical protein
MLLEPPESSLLPPHADARVKPNKSAASEDR